MDSGNRKQPDDSSFEETGDWSKLLVTTQQLQMTQILINNILLCGKGKKKRVLS